MYTKSLNVNHAKTHMIPMLKGPDVQCALCDRKFKRITSGHLRLHAQYLRSKRNLKWYRSKKQSTDVNEVPYSWKSRNESLMETYERIFGGKDQLTACIKKLITLYHPHRGKWLLMEHPILPKFAKWYQINSDNTAFRPSRLCESFIKEHLIFRHTIGVFPKSQYETYFVTWDIDSMWLPEDPSWNAPLQAKNATIAIASTLRKWGIHPHIIMSGKKGYHVTVFFQTAISIDIAMSLYRSAIQHPDGPVINSGLKIECLPIQRGNKLPLGIHWGAEKFCNFVDPYTLEPEVNPYKYLLDIIPDTPKILAKIDDKALKMVRRESSVLCEKKWSKESTEAAYKEGIIAPATRHDTLLRVAAYLRNTPSLCPRSMNELIDDLLQWSREQYDKHEENIGTEWSEHERDVERVAKYVWENPLSPGIPRVVRVTASLVHWIRKQTDVLAEQQVLFSAWYQMSIVGEHFYFGYSHVQEMTALAKDSLDKAMKGLRSKNILTIFEEYFHSEKGILPSKTRKYQFGINPPTSSAHAIILTIEKEQWDSTIWFKLLRTIFTVDQLKSYYPHSYHRILRVEPLPIGRIA